jgi:hypothetical protein
MAEFLERQRTPENYWRAVILFGQNVASYKFALAKSLIELPLTTTIPLSWKRWHRPT